MQTYRIVYEIGGRTRVFLTEGESDNEAVDGFEDFALQFDEIAIILSVKEV